MVQARRRTRLRKRAKSARIHGAIGLGDRTEFRRGAGLVLQGRGARQPQRAGKYRLLVSTRLGRRDGLCGSRNVVLQGGGARKLQCRKSAWIYESVRTRNSARFCPGAGLVSHRGGSGESHGDRKSEGLVRTLAGNRCRTVASSKRRGSSSNRSSVSSTHTDRESPAPDWRVRVGCADGRELGRTQWGCECYRDRRSQV